MSRRRHLRSLASAAPVVLPSLLMCDFGHLADELDRLEEAGARALHLDVMDGHFVPNMTYGLTLVETIRRLSDLPLDVHLMISNPSEYVERYYEAGADVITIHAEALDDPRSVLEQIAALGAAAGLAINPPTPVERIEGCLDLCDLVLVMSVQAGFGGQAFDPTALDKLRWLRDRNSSGNVENVVLEIDGGINEETIGPCAEAGAQLFVAGSAIFRNDDYPRSIATLRERATSCIRT
ncbi:MAG: ribulose-phosphate 3-epimerase [Planctomycetes bacterium]|nr:ribulose-phosphate 3-epimerase [Planctomycetota bacterium]